MTAMDLEERIDYLLEGRRDLRQRLRATKRNMKYARDRAELLVRKTNESKGVVIEVR